MTIIGRLFTHHALMKPHDHVLGIVICHDRSTFSDILAHGLPLHTLFTHACSQVCLIGTLMHQSTSTCHHEIVLACAVYKLWLPCQWGKAVRGSGPG